jgi:GTPase SAR1 family protein
VGKTCTRKALKRDAFNRDEPSTCGVESENVGVQSRPRPAAERDAVDELAVVREDVVEWSVVSERSIEERRVLAHLIAGVIKQPIEKQSKHLDDLAVAGVGRTVLDKLRVRLATDASATTKTTSTSFGASPQLQGAELTDSAASPLERDTSSDHDYQTHVVSRNETHRGTTYDAELDKLIKEYLEDPESQLKLILSMWDFGGQKLFLAMHQLFLTHNGVYVNPLLFVVDHLVLIFVATI